MGTVGIDAAPYTIPNVTGWAGSDGPDLVRMTAERVLVATGRMVERLDARLDVALAPDPLTQPAVIVDDRPRHLRLVEVLPDTRVGLSPVQRLMDTVRATLTDADRAELAARPAPDRLAVLLAAAGFDADAAVATFRELGINDRVTRASLTTMASCEGIGDPPSPLYRPGDVMVALVHQPLMTAHPSTGRRLIAEWARVEQGPYVVEPLAPHPPVA